MAWTPLGWKPVFYSENEKFPSAVLKHHYPETPNHGDFTRLARGEIGTPPIDVLVAGTPCQSFSIAGLGGGLADARGALALELLVLAERKRPRWFLWENVPGVLSHDGGRTFGTILGGLAKIGYGFAYRVLDAQFFGVAQRRERVFVVGHLGSWAPAAAVLFESACLRWSAPPSREAREDVAGPLGSCSAGGGPRLDLDGGAFIANAEGSEGVSLTASNGSKGVNNQTPLVAFDFVQITNPNNRSNPQPGDPAPTISRTSSLQGGQVRRLTPREFERLFGLPDDYTLITPKTKDAPRYRALGNTMAIPVMRWLGKRIDAVDRVLRGSR